MTTVLRHRFDATKADLKSKTKPSGWVIPKQSSTFADPDRWSNIDADVTPIERRTWSSWTVLGFWISDAMNAQGWEAPSSIIAVGLTWREAVYCIILGSMIDTIPLMLNGMIGAHLHVPFPVVARSSFGFYLARFAVVVRMITALFWHAIQTYTGSTAMTQCIRAVWPSYLDIPNTIPASVGITSQQLISHFIFWGKFSYTSLSTHTMATNVPDFTRYLKTTKGVWWQGLFLPLISLLLGLFGIISTSSAKVVYGEYIWDPLLLAAQWHGPAGRCGAFFVGFTWVVAQIGTNLSANVISASNDLTNLFPKYINIRRGVMIITITAGWIMVPWKIVHSAESLLSFMSGLAIFLCPIAAILATDYWLVKKRNIDVPGLYRRHGRYRYGKYGCNWRAVVAFLCSVVPNTPGLARAVNPSVSISAGIEHIYDINYLYGFATASFLYWALSYWFPATETLLPACIYDDTTMIDGVEWTNDGVHTPETVGDMGEKKVPHADVGQV
ncbi:hypothetical protein LTR17_014313 [Elasticomyces elasticus]|nr:hypothetical protein LTR17_014313 [Elasticomyces elasticus]